MGGFPSQASSIGFRSTSGGNKTDRVAVSSVSRNLNWSVVLVKGLRKASFLGQPLLSKANRLSFRGLPAKYCKIDKRPSLTSLIVFLDPLVSDRRFTKFQYSPTTVPQVSQYSGRKHFSDLMVKDFCLKPKRQCCFLFMVVVMSNLACFMSTHEAFDLLVNVVKNTYR